VLSEIGHDPQLGFFPAREPARPEMPIALLDFERR
jgi:hypothetical protein